jgi:hypothetical protein
MSSPLLHGNNINNHMNKMKPILAWMIILFIVPLFAAFFVVAACILMLLFELILILNPSYKPRVDKIVNEIFLDSKDAQAELDPLPQVTQVPLHILEVCNFIIFVL